jgi:uncharacterized protein
VKTALIILAKAPAPGLSKTRLMPALGAAGAAKLAQRLLDHTIETALQTKDFAHLELCVTPDLNHQAFVQHRTALKFRAPFFAWTLQSDGDLGARMQQAFERVLEHCDAAVMIGTDAPAITATQLHHAALDLTQHDAVFVPALDGGYALIGLKRMIPTLFTDMPWSTSEVMQTTSRRLAALGSSWQTYPAVHDIDEPDDLQHLPKGWVA